MPWFLTLQGHPGKAGQSLNYELQESAEVERIAEEMAGSAADDRAVAIPAIFGNRRPLTLYVRPAAWGAWAFYELSDDEHRRLMTANANAAAQAAKQQRAQTAQRPRQQRPQQGRSVVNLPRPENS